MSMANHKVINAWKDGKKQDVIVKDYLGIKILV